MNTSLHMIGMGLLCLAVLGCNKPSTEGTEEDAYTPTPSPAELEMIHLEYDPDLREFPVQMGDGQVATLLIDLPDTDTEYNYRVRLRHPDGAEQVLGCTLWANIFSHIGFVDLYGPSDQAIVLLCTDAGTGGYGSVLTMINPHSGGAIAMHIQGVFNAIDPLTTIERSANFDDPQFAAEAAYLEELKYAQNWYTDEATVAAEEDPFRYAVYRWGQANQAIDCGPMTIERIPGHHGSGGSTNDELVDGTVTYSAYFKYAVWAYDSETDESFVVFHPDDSYCWPTELRKDGDWLLINTRGEGLMLIHVPTWHLWRTGVHVYQIEEFAVSEQYGFFRINDVRIDMPDRRD
jgi:hypothetical protein